MDKEMWIEAHEELIAEYLETHPEATEDEAYKNTVDMINDLVREKYATLIDQARDRAKYD